jgi:pSer/pThr/pTyr-binding forkhead associated (FHA) protein
MPAEFRVRPRTPGAGEFGFVTDLDRILVGRGAMCDVRLPYPSVSLQHATVQRAPGGWELRDGGSSNGTWHRGRRVHAGESVRLAGSDRFSVPGFVIDVRFRPGAAPDAPSSSSVGREIFLSLLRPDLRDRVPYLEVAGGPSAGRTTALPPRSEPYAAGRDPSCDLEVPDREASRRHLVLAVGEASVRLVDAGSKNGVRVNGRLVREGRLEDGDEIEVGRTIVVFRDPRGAVLRDLDREAPGPASAEGPITPLEEAGGEEASLAEPEEPAAGSAGEPQPAPQAGETDAAGASDARSPGTASARRALPGRDLGELLAASPPAEARREAPTGGVPDGSDSLVVVLGLVVFFVCLLAIYVLLR